VFSINYRKAPENPFPSAVDDVWQAYNWLLNYSDKYFRIKKIKIQLPLYTLPFYPGIL
jgi:hypothetical protein